MIAAQDCKGLRHVIAAQDCKGLRRVLAAQDCKGLRHVIAAQDCKGLRRVLAAYYTCDGNLHHNTIACILFNCLDVTITLPFHVHNITTTIHLLQQIQETAIFIFKVP